MSYRPRELVVRAREAAMMLLATLERNEMVARFLDIYAAEYRRPGRADHPVRYREQFNTISREAILAMVLRVQAALPTRLKVRVRCAARRARQGRRSKAKKGKKGASEKNETGKLGPGDSVARSLPRGVFRGARPGAGLERR